MCVFSGVSLEVVSCALSGGVLWVLGSFGGAWVPGAGCLAVGSGTLDILNQLECAWLGLWSVWGYGPVSFGRVREAFEEPWGVVCATDGVLEGFGLEAASARRVRALDGPEALVERGRAQLEGVGDEGWGVSTAGLGGGLGVMGASTPPFLYGRGSRAVLDASPRDWVAVVGSRRVDEPGRLMAQRLGAAVVRSGRVLVSGGALGVDAAAHVGALEAGGRTVVVLGVGVDKVYPASHRGLFERVVRGGGVLLSPYVLGVGARRFHFPRRNEVMAAMSMATVVVRARRRSGSLYTADAAARYGRAVFAVPADAAAGQGQGGNALLTRGALALVSAESVGGLLDRALEGALPAGVDLGPVQGRLTGVLEPVSKPAAPVFEGDAGEVVGRLEGSGATVDVLVRQLGWPSARVGAALLELELSGAVVRQVGGAYQLV